MALSSAIGLNSSVKARATQTSLAPLTVWIEAFVQHLLDRFFRGLERVLAPVLSGFASQNDDFALIVAERGKVWVLDDNRAETSVNFVGPHRRIKSGTYPKNLAPIGPISRILHARPSPSMSGGRLATLSFVRYLQVMRMGQGAFLGGMMTRMPEWRQPRMAPPRASTRKLTKKLPRTKELCQEESKKAHLNHYNHRKYRAK